jgi:hypothetical protein
MTIGLGALCTTEDAILNPGAVHPNGLIFMADTQGSTEVDSTSALHKLFVGKNKDLFAVCADHVQVSAEIFTAVDERLIAASDPRTHGLIWRTLSEVVAGIRAERFRAEVIATRYTYFPNQIPAPEHENMMREFRAYPLGCEMIVGAFDQLGMALLYFVGP